MSVSQIVNSHNNFLARMTPSTFTGVEHDDTLSGNGTLASPLGCIKVDEVVHDLTLSGNGTVSAPLGVKGINSFTGVITDESLTGDGYTSALGLASAINVDSISANYIDMGGGSIKFTDNEGDVYVDATAIRNWNAGGGPGINHVRHDNNLTGNGNSELLGLSSNVEFDAQYSWSKINGDGVSVHSKQSQSAASVQIGTTNYGATPYVKITDTEGHSNFIYHDDISIWHSKANIVSAANSSIMLSNDSASGYAINTGVGTGFLYHNGNGVITAKEPQTKLYIHELTKDNPSVTLNLSSQGYTEVHLTTPYRYDGADPYTAVIDNKTLNLYSGAYCDLVLQDVEGTIKWCIKNSGYYSF